MTGLISVFFIACGTVALWTGITFINGTLWMSRLGGVYGVIPSPWWRMVVILPILGIGHLLFSLALRTNPVIASPAGIIFTVIPPAIYALWLIHSYPTPRILVYILVLIFFALLLSVELNKLQR